MCGIIGIITGKKSSLPSKKIRITMEKLLIASQTRGMEATGIALMTRDKIKVVKQSQRASEFVKSQGFDRLFDNTCNRRPLVAIGHTRLATDGDNSSHNNQPVVKSGIIGVHNGIIVNDEKLWQAHSDLRQMYQVDTEVLLSITDKYLTEGFDPAQAMQKSFGEIEGSASVAMIFCNRNYMILATNNGSLYFQTDIKKRIIVFASEKRILQDLRSELNGNIKQILPNTGYVIDINTCKKYEIDLKVKPRRANYFRNIAVKRQIIDYTPPIPASPVIVQSALSQKTINSIDKTLESIEKLRRCTRCILPETMPFIEFDNKGVCNYCRAYKRPGGQKGIEELRKILKPNRNKNLPDCLMTFSGGRDSSYGLHFLKKELGINPLAYTYDWGMITDLGRRNQARMVGKLGIEQIWVSADIPRKRANIRKNVLAWLKKPDLGTVPLFMAGDKQYFYFANKIARANDIKNIILCLNPLEKTDFKYGFCGIKPDKEIYYRLSPIDKMTLATYYGKQYLTNPSYINKSLIDSFSAFVSYYFIPHDYVSLFEYIKWDEKTINNTLVNEYNWEIAKDTKTTWRIGDGTAAFYNFIYLMLAGFTENDTFRSNQIREGTITRRKALELSARDNIPRMDSKKRYCNIIGIDFADTISKIMKSSLTNKDKR